MNKTRKSNKIGFSKVSFANRVLSRVGRQVFGLIFSNAFFTSYEQNRGTVKPGESEQTECIGTCENQTLYGIQSLILVCSYPTNVFQFIPFYGKVSGCIEKYGMWPRCTISFKMLMEMMILQVCIYHTYKNGF